MTTSVVAGPPSSRRENRRVRARPARVRGVAVGNALGRVRTGALGSLAVDLLARANARSVGVIGAGAQAWRQTWALNAVRNIDRVSVYSRDPSPR